MEEKSQNICKKREPKLLIIEPFYGGSHKELIDTILKYFPNSTTVTLKAKKWHWRARCSALVLSFFIPPITTEVILFISSVTNLAELLGIRPDLQSLKKVVYFHENQLIYPVQIIKQRDIQYAYNQIITCLVADLIIFNSNFNKNSFLSNINGIIKLMPDYRPKELQLKIEPKCKVIYFPIDFSLLPQPYMKKENLHTLHIVWPHRWEFDKDPEFFIKTLYELKSNCKRFLVSIIGESFKNIWKIFTETKKFLQNEIVNYGYVESKDKYFKILCSSHVVVSTAKHEFFGVSMLEATYAGCFPLAPKKLVYPEIYPEECLYESEDELYRKLSLYCENPILAVLDRRNLSINFDLYSSSTLISKYIEVLNV